MKKKRIVESEDENSDINNESKSYKKRKFEKFDDSYNDEDLNIIFNNKRQFTGVMKKYWIQRHNIFSKYDDGIILTKELWFSVTPERISKFVAKYLNDLMLKYVNNEEYISNGFTILDGFCGGGGNIVQFLDINKNNKVYAIDINDTHLDCTKINASVYCGDVKDRLFLLPLDWTHIKTSSLEKEKIDIKPPNATLEESLNSIKILKNIKFDCIFGSPPWGGPEYIKNEKFDLNNLLPFSLEEMLMIMRKYSNNNNNNSIISLFLPKNSDLDQIRDTTTR
ncbi:hypothetical protein C6P42_003351, partial [Pichia californica]